MRAILMAPWVANGVRVASEESLDPTACVGVAVDKGSLAEAPESRGLSALMRRMALVSSAKQSSEAMAATLEELGASVVRSEASCRDSLYVAAELLQPSVDGFLGILSESLVHPAFTEDQVAFQKQSMMFEREDRDGDPDHRVEDQVLATAFPHHALGASPVPRAEDVARITVPALQRFHHGLVVGSNVVVAGVGIDHASLCASAQRHLGSLPAGAPARVPAPSYVGGTSIAFHEELPTPLARTLQGTEGNPRLTLVFDAPALIADDYYCVAVLHGLMGGGASFSSGGPGKGMYTRLYSRVLNRYGFCLNVKSLLMPFEHSSLFGIAAQCEQHAVSMMLEVMVAELLYMATDVGDAEVARAKAKVKSDMFVDLESRVVAFDDLARQVCLWGRRVSSAEHAKRIDAVTKKDMLRVAKEMLCAKVPTLAALGPREFVHATPTAERVHQYIRETLK